MTQELAEYVEAVTGADCPPRVDLASILDRLHAGSPLAGTHLAIEPADRASSRSLVDAAHRFDAALAEIRKTGGAK